MVEFLWLEFVNAAEVLGVAQRAGLPVHEEVQLYLINHRYEIDETVIDVDTILLRYVLLLLH